MKMKESLVKILENPQNIHRGKSVYVSQKNLDSFIDAIDDSTNLIDLLIIPFLIYEDNVFELHDYEFDISVTGKQSYTTEYDNGNILPKEIVQNLKPKAIVAVGDDKYYTKTMRQYANSMKKMTFCDIIEIYPELQKSSIYYQLFTE